MEMSISCVIPVFNGARFLAESLDTVFAQTHLPAEVIVVNDGSTDATASVAAGYSTRILYMTQDHAGQSAARNRGVAAATCEFIAFQDADDLWDSEKLALQAARFAARPELEVSITHVRNFWEPELRHEEEAMQGHLLAKPALAGYTAQTMLARRSSFDRVGAFDPLLRSGEDIDWFARAKDASVILELMPEVLVHRRFHHGNLTRRVQPAAINESLLDSVRRSLERRRQK